MSKPRAIVLLTVAITCVAMMMSERRRKAIARRLADARRFVSRRIVDEDARTSSRAVETWEHEGGAMSGSVANDSSTR
jgi:hypothetical protein